MSVEDIIEGLPSRRIKKKADLIREAIMSSLEVSQIIQIRGSLKVIDAIQEANFWHCLQVVQRDTRKVLVVQHLHNSCAKIER